VCFLCAAHGSVLVDRAAEQQFYIESQTINR
jgi:hypothetical protein